MVLLYIIGIGFLNAKKIFISNMLLVTAVAFFYIFLQLFNGTVQVYQDIRLGDLRVDDVEKFLIEPEFFIGQIYLGE